MYLRCTANAEPEHVKAAGARSNRITLAVLLGASASLSVLAASELAAPYVG